MDVAWRACSPRIVRNAAQIAAEWMDCYLHGTKLSLDFVDLSTQDVTTSLASLIQRLPVDGNAQRVAWDAFYADLKRWEITAENIAMTPWNRGLMSISAFIQIGIVAVTAPLEGSFTTHNLVVHEPPNRGE